jgi:hypothetical protein
MKVTELRINNWVQFKHTETPVRVTLGDFVMAREYKDERLDDYEPIPLTEEWSISVGFVKQLDGNYKHPNSHEIEIFFHDRGFEVIVDSTCKNHIKHVHQLQTLYFALTGEELNQNKEDANSTDNFNSNSVPSV